MSPDNKRNIHVLSPYKNLKLLYFRVRVWILERGERKWVLDYFRILVKEQFC
jgi:hypothetical protein